MSNPHIGSTLDSLFEELGELDEVNSLTRREYEEHGLRKGRSVLRLSWTAPDGTPVTSLWLYDTAASFFEDELRKAQVKFSREWVAWDGVERVSTYNGD